MKKDKSKTASFTQYEPHLRFDHLTFDQRVDQRGSN